MADGDKRRSFRGRGPSSRKFRRAPTTGEAHAKRVAFGQKWGAINSRLAKELRMRGQ